MFKRNKPSAPPDRPVYGPSVPITTEPVYSPAAKADPALDPFPEAVPPAKQKTVAAPTVASPKRLL
jgi:hypothetical protein